MCKGPHVTGVVHLQLSVLPIAVPTDLSVHGATWKAYESPDSEVPLKESASLRVKWSCHPGHPISLVTLAKACQMGSM